MTGRLQVLRNEVYITSAAIFKYISLERYLLQQESVCYLHHSVILKYVYVSNLCEC